MLSVDGCREGYIHLLHAAMNGIESIFEFRNHSAFNDSLLNELLEFGLCNMRNNAVIIVGIAKNAFLLETINQGYVEELRQGFCRFACDGIGICV